MSKSKHGMTTEQASQKKKYGHIIEEVYAIRTNGKVIKGTSKTDVEDISGNNSIKTGNKTQWALLSQNSIVREFLENNISIDEVNNYFNFIPSREEYLKNKNLYKFNPHAKDLRNVIETNIKKFLNIIITKNGQINKISFYDSRTETDTETYNGNFFRFDASDVIDAIISSIKEIYTTPGGKVVIKGDLQLFEIELRKDKKNLLIHSKTKRILDLLKTKIKYDII